MKGQLNNYARIFEKGKSFTCSEWNAVTKYDNNPLQQDFVSYNGILYACIRTIEAGDIPPDKDPIHWFAAVYPPELTKEGLLTLLGHKVLSTEEENIFTKAQYFQAIIDMNNNKIVNVKDPELAQDVATKHYVDTYHDSSKQDILTDTTGYGKRVANLEKDSVFSKGSGLNSAILKGSSSTASGNYSIATGFSTKATGIASYSEGRSTQASGDSAHSEGMDTIAEGVQSHAEGLSTSATKKASHSEGYLTTASGDGAHAEGYNTKATGSYSHAEGNYTITSNSSEHAEGRYNKSNNGTGVGNKTRHSVGIGSSEATRKNAHEIMDNGDHYIIGIGGYDGTNPTVSDTLQDVLQTATEIDINNLF